MGYKLAPLQTNLTILQKEFLLIAMPEINRLLVGGDRSQTNNCGDNQKDRNDLRELYKKKVKSVK